MSMMVNTDSLYSNPLGNEPPGMPRKDFLDLAN